MFTYSILFFLLASPILAYPSNARRAMRSGRCNTTTAALPAPSGQTTLVKPSVPPSFIGIGVGTQNYTCGSDGTYTSIGAVVQVFDISCLQCKRDFLTIQNEAMTAWAAAPASASAIEVVSSFPPLKKASLLGQHYFIQNTTSGGISPVWDFRANAFAGNPSAFVVAAEVGGIPAPTGPSDVDWLALKGLEGELATQVFRVETKSGQPPASCTSGSAPITVKFTTQYWLYGSSLSK